MIEVFVQTIWRKIKPEVNKKGGEFCVKIKKYNPK